MKTRRIENQKKIKQKIYKSFVNLILYKWNLKKYTHLWVSTTTKAATHMTHNKRTISLIDMNIFVRWSSILRRGSLKLVIESQYWLWSPALLLDVLDVGKNCVWTALIKTSKSNSPVILRSTLLHLKLPHLILFLYIFYISFNSRHDKLWSFVSYVVRPRLFSRSDLNMVIHELLLLVIKNLSFLWLNIFVCFFSPHIWVLFVWVFLLKFLIQKKFILFFYEYIFLMISS